MLWFNVNEWAIWLTPFAVRPQCDKDSRHNPFDIFAIGPAKWTAPVKWLKYKLIRWWQNLHREREKKKTIETRWKRVSKLASREKIKLIKITLKPIEFGLKFISI